MTVTWLAFAAVTVRFELLPPAIDVGLAEMLTVVAVVTVTVAVAVVVPPAPVAVAVYVVVAVGLTVSVPPEAPRL